VRAEGGLVHWSEVPLVHLQVPVLRPTALLAQTVRAMLPSAERAAYYGGLGVLAVAGVLEWPVAAVVGAGVWLVSRSDQRGGGRTRPEGGQARSETRQPARGGRARPRVAT
jgi:hypothetical protein